MHSTITPSNTSFKMRLITASIALLSFYLVTPITAKAQTWMVSTTAHIKLGVLDKYNSLNGYKAVFIVTSQRNNQEYLLERDVPKGENGVDVLFPSEPTEPTYFKDMKGLAPQPMPGTYVWECRVNGKRVVGGHFTYPETGNDIVVVTK